MERSTIVFDGECNLCNGVIGHLLKHAPQDKFTMVPFQSLYGQELLEKEGMDTSQLNTVILFDIDGMHMYSDGFLRILTAIPAWKWVANVGIIIPRPLRDTVYKLAAANRVRWFGKSGTCTLQFS
ncbi:MAG: DUF393 domain-containing protein [Bacteroidota bacterium]